MVHVAAELFDYAESNVMRLIPHQMYAIARARYVTLILFCNKFCFCHGFCRINPASEFVYESQIWTCMHPVKIAMNPEWTKTAQPLNLRQEAKALSVRRRPCGGIAKLTPSASGPTRNKGHKFGVSTCNCRVGWLGRSRPGRSGFSVRHRAGRAEDAELFITGTFCSRMSKASRTRLSRNRFQSR